MKKLQQSIRFLELQLQLNALAKALVLGLGIGFLAWVFTSDLVWSGGFASVATLGFAWLLGAFNSRRNLALQLLHKEVKGLEFSLELLQKPSFNIADQLQIERISRQIPPQLWVVQRGLMPYLLGFAITVSAYVGFNLFDFSSAAIQENTLEKTEFITVDTNEKGIFLNQTRLRIQPPAYTKLPVSTQQALEAKAVKGSLLTWNIGFEEASDLEVFLVNSVGEKLPFAPKNKSFELTEQLVSSGIYSIQAFRDSMKVFESNFYTLEATEDQSPQIIPAEKEIYRYHFPKNPTSLNLKAKISDDFQVNEVFLVATLARGKGENVKFRESRFPVLTQAFKEKEASYLLDFKSLDFQPGDELYYYWVAVDNKQPEANISRTDTYFIKYVDENDQSDAALEGMVVQFLPEYFRSQRQIIIDTEKLIAEKSKKTAKEFGYTSNEIGYDQKLLRLRYGQYMGEEFESSAGGGSMEVEGGDLLSGYMHLHDQEGENEIEAGESHAGHSHAEEEVAEATTGTGIESLLSEYMHSHDSEEVNTYFEQSTKGALKAALEQMWQAELYLRLFEPEKSLPFQLKALEYLKTVQQKSRVYVKRTSYDPPPIKEKEKRLTGELKDLDARMKRELIELEKQIEPYAAKVLGILVKSELSAADRQTVRELGEIWSRRMEYTGLKDLKLLLHLQELESGKLDVQGRAVLAEKLYTFAGSYKNTGASYLAPNSLKDAFRRKLK
ncbi:MAG: hypothetical protein Q8S14_04725 [Algoriphagus sp.]|uniref:hypothetical protein n=1 Tax=Algoriphagus sp. TaxID=1872435 RepID=UPI00272FF60C|nr:hypothetical protein [Algoriphagus sp.]MDP2040960.1 hypothetical protein [Algoriphagus sp.]MDP3471159.1 hypothetical protein [Algoriphagus sp.]